jgi:hypothetical protein
MRSKNITERLNLTTDKGDKNDYSIHSKRLGLS